MIRLIFKQGALFQVTVQNRAYHYLSQNATNLACPSLADHSQSIWVMIMKVSLGAGFARSVACSVPD